MKGLLQNYFIKAYSPMGVTRTVALVYSFPINASAGKRTESLENVEGKSEGLLIRRFGFHSTHRKFEIWRELKSWRLTNCVKRYIIYNTSYLSSNFQFNILYIFLANVYHIKVMTFGLAAAGHVNLGFYSFGHVGHGKCVSYFSASKHDRVSLNIFSLQCSSCYALPGL